MTPSVVQGAYGLHDDAADGKAVTFGQLDHLPARRRVPPPIAQPRGTMTGYRPASTRSERLSRWSRCAWEMRIASIGLQVVDRRDGYAPPDVKDAGAQERSVSSRVPASWMSTVACPT